MDSTNSLASAVVQSVPRACGKLNLAAIVSEGLSTKLYQSDLVAAALNRL